MHATFWNTHYKAFHVQEPSDFARFCSARVLQGDDRLVELGCGNGRDGLLLAQHAASYLGIDACPIAIESFTQTVTAQAARNIELRCGDFTALGFDSVRDGERRLAIYSRFTLHSISYAEADRLFGNLEQIAAGSWVCMLEARTIYDELYGVGRSVGPHEFETDHYRRFIDPAELLTRLAGRFAVRYFEVARGFAKFGGEDPVLLRAVFGPRGASPDSL